MDQQAFPRPRGTGKTTTIGTLALAGLLLVACGTADSGPARLGAPPQSGVSRPMLQVATPAATPPAAPPATIASATPGSTRPSYDNPDVGSSGGFGIESQPLPPGAGTPAGGTPMPTLPANPEPANPPPATPPPANPPAAPAPPAAAPSTQNRTVPPDRLNIRGRLVYVNAKGEIWSAARTGQDARIVLARPADRDETGRVTDLHLSPDAQRLIYTTNADSADPHAYLLDLGKGTLTRQKYNGTWAADNKHIVTAVNGKVIVLNVEDGSEQTVSDGDHPNWTADNRIIATRNGNLWILPYPSASEARQLTDWPRDGEKSWGFSNRLQYHYANRILFAGITRDRAGAQGNGLGLWAWDIPTHQLIALGTPGGNAITSLALSPSGMQLAWAQQAHSSACASPGSVGISRADGSGPATMVQIPQDDTRFFAINGLTWLPDQTLIYAATEWSCADGKLTSRGPAKLYAINPAVSRQPTALVEGSNPVWIMPVGLGQGTPALVADR